MVWLHTHEHIIWDLERCIAKQVCPLMCQNETLNFKWSSILHKSGYCTIFFSIAIFYHIQKFDHKKLWKVILSTLWRTCIIIHILAAFISYWSLQVPIIIHTSQTSHEHVVVFVILTDFVSSSSSKQHMGFYGCDEFLKFLNYFLDHYSKTTNIVCRFMHSVSMHKGVILLWCLTTSLW